MREWGWDQGRVCEKGKASGCTLTTLHLPQASTVLLGRSPWSRWFLQWEKRPEVISSLQASWVTLMGAPELQILDEGIIRKWRDSTLLGIPSWHRMGAVWKTEFLRRAQLVVPTNDFTHLQNQVCAVWSEKAQVYLIWALKGGVLPALEHGLLTLRQKRWVIAWPAVEHGPHPHLTWRLTRRVIDWIIQKY